MHAHLILAAAVSLATSALAQVPPAIPFPRTMDLLVVDTTFDGIWRLTDWNQDGDYNDPGETSEYYSGVVGTITFGNPSCIAVGNDGTVYVADSTADVVVALRDQNGDGSANDAGEHRVFFDLSNAGGLAFESAQGLTVDALGRVFVTDANSDRILVLEDLDGDGDANDLNEARDYHTIPGTSVTGDSIPTDVLAGLDANLYFAENGATGVIGKGVYKLVDLNSDGDCNDPGERSLFWDTDPLGPASPFHYGLAIDGNFRFYITDHSSNEQVWTAFDLNGNGTIEPSEQTLFYQTSASTWWDVVVQDDGTVLLCEDQTPDRITALRDLNNDGDALDPGEAIEIYNDTVSSNPNVRPRGAALLRAPLLNLSVPTVSFGSPTDFVVSTEKPADVAAVFLSIGLVTPFPVAPFGQGEIDISLFIPLGFGLADANGSFVLPFTVPNTPTAIGTYGSQAWCGDNFRQFLSNGALLTVTP